ncbi:hypothetical protein SAMN05444172_9055 [Burkholderia sp. GAS332]|nr:hypothetical protein SAMN05444172_9055 [Burkholderia sp. GAS332]
MTLLRQPIETYIHAKDGNRPHLMAGAFTIHAELAIEVKTDEISLPTAIKGRDAISTVLVSQFAQRYENIYMLCIGTPPADEHKFDCNWFVCMTEKDTGAARVGFGRYEWHCADRSGMVSMLRITIEEMTTLPKDAGPSILEWVRRLPYPWCPAEQLA